VNPAGRVVFSDHLRSAFRAEPLWHHPVFRGRSRDHACTPRQRSRAVPSGTSVHPRACHLSGPIRDLPFGPWSLEIPAL